MLHLDMCARDLERTRAGNSPAAIFRRLRNRLANSNFEYDATRRLSSPIVISFLSFQGVPRSIAPHNRRTMFIFLLRTEREVVKFFNGALDRLGYVLCHHSLDFISSDASIEQSRKSKIDYCTPAHLGLSEV